MFPADPRSGGLARRPAAGRRGPTPYLSRPRRVLLVLAAVWVINVFDLTYTLAESFTGGFVEANPLAARLLHTSPTMLIAYKALLLTASSTILLSLRRRRITELGCWLLLGAYVYVAACWGIYYQHQLAALNDPAVNAPPIIGLAFP